MKRFGKTREKLAEMLSKALTEFERATVIVYPEDLWMQQGAYRHATWDLARWGAYVEYELGRGRVMLAIHSWDTMKQCVKGFTISRPFNGSPTEREVTATYETQTKNPLRNLSREIRSTP